MLEEALYVLKLRRDRPQWRATLEDVRQHAHWEFASLEACLIFIAERHATPGSSLESSLSDDASFTPESNES
jgi:hypothetical protein